MKVPEKYYDEIFEFNGLWDVVSKCGLKIIDKGGKKTVIVTELYQDNPGTSVTYAGYALARQICERKNLEINNIRYLECNPDEEYFEVTFPKATGESNRATYRQLSKDEVMALFV